jgi:hypothetical protein
VDASEESEQEVGRHALPISDSLAYVLVALPDLGAVRMNRLRLLALSASVASLTAVALLGHAEPTNTASKMQLAAKRFLDSLSPELKQQAFFQFEDPHRIRWYFTPQQDKNRKFTRKGVRLEAMTAEQKAAALALLKTGLSERGYEQATTILTLEGLLAELEGPKGAMVRNPGWYFVSVFGEPSATGQWGWRFEGHHMSVNYTLNRGEVVSATPILFGANPAEVKAGDKKGLRALPEIEEHARTLIKSFTTDQNTHARQAKDFDEIKEGQPKAEVGAPVGIRADQLTVAQRETLLKLLRAYAERMPADLAEAEMKRVQATPLTKLTFAYSGSPEPGQPYTYRVYAPEFIVEFLNIQADSARNPANHIHSTWRRLPADFAWSE